MPDDYMQKASRALSAARLLLANSEIEGACNRAYYAMFAAAHAALLASGQTVPETSTKTHRGLIGAFGLHLVQTGRVPRQLGRSLNEVEQIRLLADYTGEDISLEKATWAVDQAESFVEAMRAVFMHDAQPNARGDSGPGLKP